MCTELDSLLVKIVIYFLIFFHFANEWFCHLFRVNWRYFLPQYQTGKDLYRCGVGCFLPSVLSCGPPPCGPSVGGGSLTVVSPYRVTSSTLHLKLWNLLITIFFIYIDSFIYFFIFLFIFFLLFLFFIIDIQIQYVLEKLNCIVAVNTLEERTKGKRGRGGEANKTLNVVLRNSHTGGRLLEVTL